MTLPSKLTDVLETVQNAQRIVNEQNERLANLLDSALLENGNFEHLNREQLEEIICALPEGCFYTVYLKGAWRKCLEHEPLATVK